MFTSNSSVMFYLFVPCQKNATSVKFGAIKSIDREHIPTFEQKSGRKTAGAIRRLYLV